MKILVTPKVNPDLDGLASAYAYSRFLNKLGQNTDEGIFGEPHIEAKYLIEHFQIKDINLNPQGIYEKFILVDASNLKGMPKVIGAQDVIGVIDHREVQEAEKLFPKAKIKIELLGATATLITEKYKRFNVPIDFHSALLLYSAIYTHTLNFQISSATARDREAATWLKAQAKIPKNIIHELYQYKNKVLVKNLEENILNDAKEYIFGDKHIGIAQLEIIESKKFVKENLKRLLEILLRHKRKHNLYFNFLTIANPERGINLFVTEDESAREFLRDAFAIEFRGAAALKKGVVLRKELEPLIKRYFK